MDHALREPNFRASHESAQTHMSHKITMIFDSKIMNVIDFNKLERDIADKPAQSA
jgi:hypothetical protein